MKLEVTASRYQLHATLEPRQIGAIFIKQTNTIDKLGEGSRHSRKGILISKERKYIYIFFLYYQYFRIEFHFFKTENHYWDSIMLNHKNYGKNSWVLHICVEAKIFSWPKTSQSSLNPLYIYITVLEIMEFQHKYSLYNISSFLFYSLWQRMWRDCSNINYEVAKTQTD